MSAARSRQPSGVAGLKRGMAAGTPAESVSPLTDLTPEAPRRPRPEKPKRTRYTLDLDEDQHQFLKSHAHRIEADASEVMRALLSELRDDPDLAGRVRARVWQKPV